MNNQMDYPMTNNLPGTSSEKTINSQELLVMVNDARRQCGEPEIRNNVFVDRIKDELSGEHYKIFVVQKSNNTESQNIEMSFKQALRVAARESKAVRRTLVDQLEDMAGNKQPMSEMEMIAAMAADAVRQQKRISHVEEKIESVAETVENIKRGSVPAGWSGYSVLKIKSGMTPSKCKTLVKAYCVPTDTITMMTPEGQPRPMSIVHDAEFMAVFRHMMGKAEQRGTRWWHPKIGLFQALGWSE
ncbi:DNA-binding protein [Pantoea agglomerans]|uniref:DNA-binding protein n=1 Tax=Enterobacter agglomerans TaxID=549 RepID=UPI0020181BB4|nr:DNA-binding protein [Pantoea agglomerans]